MKWISKLLNGWMIPFFSYSVSVMSCKKLTISNRYCGDCSGSMYEENQKKITISSWWLILNKCRENLRVPMVRWSTKSQKRQWGQERSRCHQPGVLAVTGTGPVLSESRMWLKGNSLSNNAVVGLLQICFLENLYCFWPVLFILGHNSLAPCNQLCL